MKRQIPPCPSGIYWRVAAGDTLYKIAKANNIPLNQLLQANPNINPNNLQIGQSICLPKKNNNTNLPPCPSGVYWEVSAGDTLYKIATASNVSIAKLIKANPGIDANNLKIGQNICIPQ